MAIRRGDIYYTFLDPAFGREAGGYKKRPVVVLSIDRINALPLVVTVIPGTSDKGKPGIFRNIVRVEPTEENGLSAATLFECHQIRALDRGRFTDRPIGFLSDQDLILLEEAVKYNLGFMTDP